MKKLIFTVAIFALGVFTYAQISTHYWQTGNYSLKETQKALVKIGEGLFASKFEVTNWQYTSFLNYLKQSNKTDKYLIAQIDSANWRNELSFNEPYVEHYHTHPAYAEYPVVNISYEGALLFCDWLTDQYNADEKRKYEKVIFRLPTEKEWITAAKGGNLAAVYPWDGNELQNSKGDYRCNFKRPSGDQSIAGNLTDNADVTAPVNSYEPNKYGLYNMSGNVAEMLSNKRVVKGGGWQDSEQYMKIDNEVNREGMVASSPNIGFRYFMEVVEK